MSSRPSARQMQTLQRELSPYLEGLLDRRYAELPRVKEIACKALGWLKDEGSVAILMHVAKTDADPSVRAAAVRALVAIDDPVIA